jgi:cell division protein FtsL
MAISSIHIEGGASGYFAHNSREQKTTNAIFKDEENYVSCDMKSAFETYKSELETRSAAYTERTGQKLQARTKTHLSAIVNLNAEHTEHDIQRICDYLEQTFDTKVIQFAIHRDEGHIADDGITQKKNYHAHIEFMGIDSQGKSLTQKLKKKQLSELQTKTAEILGMERGRNYIAEQAPRPKRLNTYEFKKVKEQEQEERLLQKATKKELKEEIKQLRAELQEQKATRSDYAQLEELNRELQKKLKNKDLTQRQLQMELDSVRIKLLESQEEVLSLKATIDTQKTRIEELEQNLSELEAKKVLVQNRSNGYFGLNPQISEKIRKYETKIQDLTLEIHDLRLTPPAPPKPKILTLDELDIICRTVEVNKPLDWIMDRNWNNQGFLDNMRKEFADDELIERLRVTALSIKQVHQHRGVLHGLELNEVQEEVRQMLQKM